MFLRQGCLLPRKSREETTEVGARSYRKSKKKLGTLPELAVRRRAHPESRAEHQPPVSMEPAANAALGGGGSAPGAQGLILTLLSHPAAQPWLSGDCPRADDCAGS